MNSQLIWKVQVQDRVYEAHKDELIEWIREGAVLPTDRVQRGNLKWLAASRVPEFARLFSKPPEFENTGITAEVTDSDGSAISAQPESVSDEAQVAETDSTGPSSYQSEALDLNADSLKHCVFHPSRPTAFICDICRVTYCNLCPNRYGGVRLCPSCGGLCTTYENLLAGSRPQGAMNRPYARRDIESDDAAQDKFGIGINEIISALESIPISATMRSTAVLYVVAALGISSA